jgi:hypothetical protein
VAGDDEGLMNSRCITCPSASPQMLPRWRSAITRCSGVTGEGKSWWLPPQAPIAKAANKAAVRPTDLRIAGDDRSRGAAHGFD